MLLHDNVKMAWASLNRARGRSLLTMLGIIIGVAAVIVTVSLGEGLKQQVGSQVGAFDRDLITVRPGQTVKRTAGGTINGVDLPTVLGSGTLSEQDVGVVQQTAGVGRVAPLGLLALMLDIDGKQSAVTVITTGATLPDILHYKLGAGGFWRDDDETKNIAVLGKTVAQTVFGDTAPIGQSFRVRGQNFLVRGVFEQLPPNPLFPTVDFNKAVFMPYATTKTILGTAPPIAQLLVIPQSPAQLDGAVAQITTTLQSAHGGQEDFTVLKQAENSLPANAIVGAITRVVVAIATVSLALGGVGIMNIMLVAVTERTREIGIRKAIGATNRQILNQFLAEAAVLSLAGAASGVILAFVTNFMLRLFTSLQPAITLWVIGLSVGAAIAIGLVFGIMPAFQAARKDPIDALRYE